MKLSGENRSRVVYPVRVFYGSFHAILTQSLNVDIVSGLDMIVNPVYTPVNDPTKAPEYGVEYAPVYSPV